MATSKSTDVEVPAEGSRFPALSGGGSTEVLEILRENVGDGGFNVTDLDFVGIPAGGGSNWEIPSLEGPTSAREIEGVMVAWRGPRAFWVTSVDEAGDETTPPDCSSFDGNLGVGMYGVGSEKNMSGECATCPMNEWGSSLSGGNGKACRETRQLMMVLPGSVLPIVVGLPPTSIFNLRKYMLRLAGSGRPHYAVTTKLTLDPQQKGGQRWSVVVPSMGVDLTPEEKAGAKALGDTLRAGMQRQAQQALQAATVTE